MVELDTEVRIALSKYLLRLGDDRLILGHRLSEWCGHGPIVEEDIALANIALDCLGHAVNYLTLAGELEGKGRSADDLAYWRDEREFRNCELVELPRGDFGFTIARQFIFDLFSVSFLEELKSSAYQPLAGAAHKALGEVRYHARHSTQWILRLGDGTEESHARVQTALDDLWTYTGELFYMDELDTLLISRGVVPDLKPIKQKWLAAVQEVIGNATLALPDVTQFMASGCRAGRHSEALGPLLAEMQILPRSHPGASW